ncbi:MAG TPA: primosomal protein [Elainellaceae cyanobacterium]
MAGAIDQIERDIAVLEKSLEAIALEFQTLYTRYLDALGQTVRQQLVVTGFQICTKGYPERFLSLSLAQRQKVQQALRQLANQSKEQINSLLDASLAALEDEDLDEDDDDFNDIETLELEFDSHLSDDVMSDHVSSTSSSPLPEFSLETLINSSLSESESQESETPPEIDESPVAELSDQSEAEDQDAEDQDAEDQGAEDQDGEADGVDDQEDTDSSSIETNHPLTPDLLLNQQEILEESINEVLRNLSYAANRLMQQSGILPKKVPDKILEAAAKAELSTEVVSPPNLLNLIVETDDGTDDESKITHIMAIRLRASEIEFGDTRLSAWRSKIREFSARLNRLNQDYENKHHELAIAEAEAAWRASWYDD